MGLYKIIDLELSRNKQHAINLAASITNMVVGALISFFLTPYIVKTIGVEANGFVSLANSFISYATLVGTALNSMAGRFIMISYYNNDEEKVSRLYSSLYWGNIFLALVYGLLGFFCVIFLEKLVSIPVELQTDVKILFALLFMATILYSTSAAWSMTPYIKNKMYLGSMNGMLSSVVRLLLVFALFALLPPTVSLVGVSILLSTLLTVGLHWIFKRRLFGQYKAKVKYFSWTSIWTLVSSGIWNTISSVGNILTSGLDLLIANIFIDAKAMGILAIAKVMPGFVSTLNFTIANVFTPSLIIDYAHSDTKEIVHTISQSAKLISVICTIPLAFLFVFGEEFYRLWQPTQDAKLLFILSTITIFGRVFFSGMQPLFNVFTVVNRVKENSLVTIVNGAIITLVTLVLVKYTDLGIYAVAGVSVFFCFLKNVLFVVPYSAKYLGLNKFAFMNTLTPSVLCTALLCVLGYVMKLFLPVDNWLHLIVAAVIFGVVGLAVSAYAVLSSSERKVLMSKLFHRKMHG